MKTWVRRSLWGLGVVLGVPLVLATLWWLLNLRDVPTQPWPQVLALPANTLAAEANLHAALAGVPRPQPTLGAVDCPQDDCLPAWRERVSRWVEAGRAQPAFVAACEALGARTDLRYEDPMPDPLRIEGVSGPSGPLVDCHAWLVGRALQAALDGASANAVQWLQQADRMDRAMLDGGRSLVAHVIAVGLWERKLQVMKLVAALQPALLGELAPLAQLDARGFLVRQQAWVRVEANYQRVAVDSLRGQACPEQLVPRALDRVGCELGSLALQPEYATQLFGQRWLQVHERLQQAESLPAALPGLREALLDGPTGWWPRVRHTVPTVMDEVARPVMPSYFDRAADLQLAAEATRLWLLDPRTPLPERASPELRARLTAADGGWRLEPFAPDRARAPRHWALLT